MGAGEEKSSLRIYHSVANFACRRKQGEIWAHVLSHSKYYATRITFTTLFILFF
jgi:hypothetical protein